METSNPIVKQMMVEKAAVLFRDKEFVTTALIQRKLKIGFRQAVEIIDELERIGLVEKSIDHKHRVIKQEG